MHNPLSMKQSPRILSLFSSHFWPVCLPPSSISLATILSLPFSQSLMPLARRRLKIGIPTSHGTSGRGQTGGSVVQGSPVLHSHPCTIRTPPSLLGKPDQCCTPTAYGTPIARMPLTCLTRCGNGISPGLIICSGMPGPLDGRWCTATLPPGNAWIKPIPDCGKRPMPLVSAMPSGPPGTCGGSVAKLLFREFGSL